MTWTKFKYGIKRVLRWLKDWWWIVIAGITFILGILIASLFRSKVPQGVAQKIVTDVVANLEHIDRETEKKRAAIRAETDKEREELKELEKISDGHRRRKAKAEWLRDKLFN